MDFYHAWSLVFSGLSALGTIVAAGGAIFAIAQIRKHWRDDDTVATIFADDQRLNKIGKRPIWTCQLRVVNSGKVNFSVKEVAFCDERLNESFKFRCFPRCEYALEQGAYVQGFAAIGAKEDGITFPEQFEIKVMSADGKILGRVTIKIADASTAP